MVARAGGYFGNLFKGYCGVTQGNPLPPTIFNVVRDTIILHWVTVVEPTVNILEGLDLSIGELVEYLYADNGLVASTQPERLQRNFNVLTSLFDQVGFRKNTRKTVRMSCQPCHAPGRISLESYKMRTMGTWTTFWEQQQKRVN